MPIDDKKWKDSFNQSSLDEEKWLEPAMDVFDNITAQTHPKKRKRKFLILIFLFISLIASFSLFNLQSFDSNSNDSDKSSSDIVNQTASKNVVKKEAIDIVYDKNEGNNNDESHKSLSNSSNEKKLFAKPKKSKSDVINKKTTFSSKPNSKVKKSSVLRINKGTQPDENTNIEQSIILRDKKTESLVKSNTDILNITTSEVKGAKATSKIILLNKLLLINNLNSNIRYSTLPINLEMPFSVLNETSDEKINKTSSLSFGILKEIWKFNLNSNLTTALDPADFTHSTGNGNGLIVKYQFPSVKKTSFNAGVSVQKINFNSGHNSTLNYEPQNEQANMSNAFDLTMASPLGFIRSNVVIERRSNNTSQASDIIVDLDNKHSLTNLDFFGGIDYLLLSSHKWDLNIGIHSGINYLITVSNDLSSFTTNNSNYVSASTGPVTSMQSTKTITPYLGTGLSLNRTLSKDWKVGIDLNIKSSLTPLYQENDFSTQVMRYNFSLNLKKVF